MALYLLEFRSINRQKQTDELIERQLRVHWYVQAHRLVCRSSIARRS